MRLAGCCYELFYGEVKEIIVKNLLPDFGLLSVIKYEDIPYGMIQLFKSIVNFCIVWILTMGNACVSFENCPVV